MTTTAPKKLVELTDHNQTVSGLVRLHFTATNPQIKILFSKMATLNNVWNKSIPVIEAAIKASSGKRVVLLIGSYVRESKGMVSGVSALPLPGYTYLQRKGYDTATGTFFMWAVIK